MSQKERIRIVQSLNNQYKTLVMVPGQVAVEDCLKKLAEAVPYRWLNGFSIDVGRSLSSMSWENKFQTFPEHLKFIEKVRSAQITANKSGKRSQICWRGFRTSILPSDKTEDKKEMLQRLVTALKSIRSTSTEEKEV